MPQARVFSHHLVVRFSGNFLWLSMQFVIECCGSNCVIPDFRGVHCMGPGVRRINLWGVAKPGGGLIPTECTRKALITSHSIVIRGTVWGA